ncbi:MAG TPA: hypothetical protein PLR60_01355 [Syntrophorhabdaceae bacterium]|nr:hypothetical protein [Syntrophorhabdaceae bacterium]
MKNPRLERYTSFFPLISIFLLAGTFVLPFLTYGAESSCVKCHTNDQLLKSLHKPPRVIMEEGEG